jgi:hypothetical protein
MPRLLLFLAYLAVVIFSIVDIVTIDGSRVRALPKWAWVLIVTVVPVVGVVLWFLVGRLRADSPAPGRRPSRPSGPDDDPAFLNRIGRDRQQREQIEDLERRLAEIEEEERRRDQAGAGAGDGAPGDRQPGDRLPGDSLPGDAEDDDDSKRQPPAR